MADKKKDTGKTDGDRINLSEDYEVQYWSAKFDVSAEKLKKAVKEVGDNSKRVEKFLKKKKV